MLIGLHHPTQPPYNGKKREISGFSHSIDLTGSSYVVGTTCNLEMGYNRNPPAKWGDGKAKVIYGR